MANKELDANQEAKNTLLDQCAEYKTYAFRQHFGTMVGTLEQW